MPAGLLGERAGADLGARARVAEERVDERARVFLREAADADHAHVAAEEREHLLHALHGGLGGILFEAEQLGLERGAHRREQQQLRLARRPHDLGEEREAVGVGPLEIVDHEHERPVVREPDQEIAQRIEQASAEHLRIERPRSGRGASAMASTLRSTGNTCPRSPRWCGKIVATSASGAR